MLSEVGGLTALIHICFSSIVGAWNFNSFDDLMVSRLFKIKKPDEEINPDFDFYQKSDYIKLFTQPNCKEWLISLIPTKCICCKKNRREIAMHKAREKLNKEVNIIEIVKSWRYYERCLKYLLPEKTRMDFKERSRYITINPDPKAENKSLFSGNSIEMRRMASARR